MTGLFSLERFRSSYTFSFGAHCNVLRLICGSICVCHAVIGTPALKSSLFEFTLGSELLLVQTEYVKGYIFILPFL